MLTDGASHWTTTFLGFTASATVAALLKITRRLPPSAYGNHLSTMTLNLYREDF